MSALLASRFEQLCHQPAAVDHDVSSRWTSATPAASAAHNYSKKAPSSADQIFKDAGLRMRIATEADKPAILEFQRNFFFHDEPLNVAIKLLTSGYGTRSEDLEGFCLSGLTDNVTLVCESIDNRVEGIAALCLCGIVERSEEETLGKTVASLPPLEPLQEKAGPDERFARIERLLDTEIAEANVFGRMPNLDRLIDIKILSVHPLYRGKRVAIGLCDKIRDIAIEKKIDILRIVCSSRFSALAAARLGYECIHSLPYSDFVDSEGKRIFNTEPPHNAVSTYILDLKHNNS